MSESSDRNVLSISSAQVLLAASYPSLCIKNATCNASLQSNAEVLNKPMQVKYANLNWSHSVEHRLHKGFPSYWAPLHLWENRKPRKQHKCSGKLKWSFECSCCHLDDKRSNSQNSELGDHHLRNSPAQWAVTCGVWEGVAP